MKSILLSAGLGTRLRPLTNSTPKCMLPINGKPLLEIWINNLINLNVNKIIINTHYKHKQVVDFIMNSKYKKNIELFHERKLLGTCGTLLANIHHFDQEILLLHSDNYCLANMKEFVEAHSNRPKNCLMTMLTFKTENPETCGIVETENGVVTGFHEKVNYYIGNIANGATYILSKEFLEIIKKDFSNASDFSIDILPHFINRIYTYHTNEVFIDIGNVKNYNLANNLIK